MTKMIDERHTLYVGRVHPKVTEEILFELFLQAGPLRKVVLPKKERGETAHKGFAFVEFKHQESLDYAIAVLTGASLYGQQLVIKHKNKLKESEDTDNANVDGKEGNNTSQANNDRSKQVRRQSGLEASDASNPSNNQVDTNNNAKRQQGRAAPSNNTSQVNTNNSNKSRQGLAAPKQQYNNSYTQSYHQQNNYQNRYPQQNSPANYNNKSRDSGRTHKSYRGDSRYAPYNSNESNNYGKDYDRKGSGRSYGGGDARNVEVSYNRRRSYLPVPYSPYESRGNSRGSRR